MNYVFRCILTGRWALWFLLIHNNSSLYSSLCVLRTVRNRTMTKIRLSFLKFFKNKFYTKTWPAAHLDIATVGIPFAQVLTWVYTFEMFHKKLNYSIFETVHNIRMMKFNSYMTSNFLRSLPCMVDVLLMDHLRWSDTCPLVPVTTFPRGVTFRAVHPIKVYLCSHDSTRYFTNFRYEICKWAGGIERTN